MGLVKNTHIFLFLATIMTVTGLSTATLIALHNARTMELVDPEVFLDIWNRMPQGELTVNCKSGDHQVPTKSAGTDVAISIEFQINLKGTLYKCDAQSPYGRLSFDAYDLDRDYPDRCRTHCVWNAKEDGVHGVNQDNVDTIFVPWVAT